MTERPAPPPVPPPGGAPARIGALAWLLIVGVALACRLWRFEAVGEGVDEGSSVETTRAMLDGRFSWDPKNEFVRDSFAAKFQPVAEAIAVPFTWILGDRPLAFRLPWLIASIALLVMLVRYAGRRFGRTTAIVLGALYALDYRNVYYAQTHRYVLATEVFAFAAFLASARALRVGRWTGWIPVVGLSLLLLHAHLMGVWVLFGLFLALSAPRPSAVRAVPPRVLFTVLLAYAAAMLVLLRRSSDLPLYDSGDVGPAALSRSAAWTVRMVFGLGVVAGPLAILGALRLVRGRGFEDRAPALVVLATFVLWLPAGAFVLLEPRYAACIQPFVFVAAAAAGGAILDRLASRPALRAALVAACVVVTAAPTAWYLGTGGARDLEAPIDAALREHARPGEAVLYDIGSTDAFRRRPADLPAVPRSILAGGDAEERLEAAGVRWIVRSSVGPAAIPDLGFSVHLYEKLEDVATSEGPGLFQEPIRLTLYRVRP